jgi:hypothetical protein
MTVEDPLKILAADRRKEIRKGEVETSGFLRKPIMSNDFGLGHMKGCIMFRKNMTMIL